MAINQYIRSNVKSEQDLYENLVIETLKTYGVEVYYIPRDIVNENKIFGDDVPSRFNSSYKVEMYIDNIEGFAGEGDIFSRFGVEIRDEATFVVARRRWRDAVKRYDNEISGDRPREGDLIYLPMSKSLFQIQHVEHEDPFYQLQNVPLFRCRATLFEYNDEDLDTGVEAIDNIEKDYAYKYILTLNDNSLALPGNTVSQLIDSAEDIKMSGEVIAYSDSDRKLHLVHVGASDGKYHNFLINRPITITGLNKNDSDIQVSVVAQDNQISSDEQNTDFSTLTDFLDFTENNPFGDPENN
jgi:hypothetical protein